MSGIEIEIGLQSHRSLDPKQNQLSFLIPACAILQSASMLFCPQLVKLQTSKWSARLLCVCTAVHSLYRKAWHPQWQTELKYFADILTCAGYLEWSRFFGRISFWSLKIGPTVAEMKGIENRVYFSLARVEHDLSVTGKGLIKNCSVG